MNIHTPVETYAESPAWKLSISPFLQEACDRRDERGGRRPLEAGLTATFFFKGHLCSQINKTTPGSSRSCQLLANSCSEIGVSAGEPSKHFSLPEAEHFSFCPQGALTLHAQMQGRLRTHQDGKSGELMWRYGGCLHVYSPVSPDMMLTLGHKTQMCVFLRRNTIWNGIRPQMQIECPMEYATSFTHQHQHTGTQWDYRQSNHSHTFLTIPPYT